MRQSSNIGGQFVATTIFCLLAILPLSATATGRYRLSFDECVRLALKNNDQIRAADYDIELSNNKMKEAHPRGIPVVKYEHRIAPVPKDVDNAASSFFGGDISVFNSFKLEVGSALTTFGKISTAQNLAQLGIDASWFQKQKTTDDVIFKIYQVYQGILLGRELLDLAEEAQNAIEGKIEELQKERAIDQLGILKMKVALFEVQRKVEEGQKKIELGLMALKIQSGLEMDVDLDIKGGGLTPVSFNLSPFEAYLDDSRDRRPEYQLLDKGIQAKEKQVKLAKLDRAPNLGVGGFFDIGRAPGVTGDEDESTFTNPFNFTKAGVGLQLKGEFDYVKTNAKIKQAKADLLKTIYQKRAAVHGLEIDLKEAYLKIKEAHSLMNKAEEEKKVARQMVFLTKSNLDIGLGERKDYLDALQSYLVFQGRQYESIYNYNVAVFELKKKTGKLSGMAGKEIQ
ncbi:MAG: TolC family protein [Deltaproteobacteria bacterium]|nr:TolC family protein [Deltaproteobacteria bacterium]